MKHDEVTLDPRTQIELCARVAELAASYTPEWQFTVEDPDIGSTLALIFTQQMAENIRRLNRLPEKYHTEFVNLMGLSLQPAYPASGVVVAQLIRGTVPGVMLPAGSRLLADNLSGESLCFETVEDVYLTNARITDVLSVSGSRGRVIPIQGGPKAPQLIPQIEEFPGKSADEETDGQEPKVGDFTLFDYQEPGIEKNALLLYHRSVFNTQSDVALLLRPVGQGGIPLAKELCDEKLWRWSYYDGTKLKPFDSVETEGDTLILRRQSPSGSVSLDGEDYHVLCLEALDTLKSPVLLEDIRVASRSEEDHPQIILHEGEELEPERCLPFGDTVSVFDECYIGDDWVFSQQGATVQLSFRLSAVQKIAAISAQQEAEELKIIKRKPRAIQYELAESAPQRIVVEYFNGTGWRKLPCLQDCSTLFDGKHSGQVALRFVCPEDWKSVPVGGYEGRSLRLRVTQADNCYLLPCRHTMPCMEDVTLSYDYLGQWEQPQRVRTVNGTQTEDQTRALQKGGLVTAFRPLSYPAAALYLGFDRPLEGAPISMFFDVEENVHFRTEPITVEYSTRDGFKALKVMDGTRNFSAAGTMLFLPPSDFAAVEVEGLRRWWLRICASPSAAEGYHPRVRSLMLNALSVRNQQTLEERAFYIDTARPNMRFALGAENILSAEVFVSELGQLSRRQMQELMDKEPQNVRVEHDFLGEITSFFVRWQEVDSFDRSQPGDRHYMIDRMNNAIVFGDGVHVRIPRSGRDVAFTVRCVSCDGGRGNLPAGAISRFYGNMMYVESVRNPVDTYAGSDLESVERARRRGAELLSNRGRLISQADFTRAVYAFSDSVEKVKCLAGVDIDGQENPALITIAVMTGDYDRGAYAFNNIRYPLLRYLLGSCDAAVTSDCLVLSEPAYVEISVSVWAEIEPEARPFDVQNLILDRIRQFLDPLGHSGTPGWEIGVLPTENQLKMLLQSLRFPGYISHIVTTARYVDKGGAHEAGLDALPKNPFAIAVSGKHEVHIQLR